MRGYPILQMKKIMTLAVLAIALSCTTDEDLNEILAETTPETISADTTQTETISQKGTANKSSIPFPGAQGFGKNATGGRGGIVVYVTNLNDSGTGSLRAALTMTVPRTIVFRVGGTIKAKTYLSIPENSGNVTIAGQTAPGGGITIRNGEFRIHASNVIIRHIRFRLGNDVSGNADALRIVAYAGKTVENIMIDHCSMSWGRDETVELGGAGLVRNVTIQNSIISEGTTTNYGLIAYLNVKNFTVYRNLFAHNSERNIRGKATTDFEMINNTVYGYKAATSVSTSMKADIISNNYITNPLVKVYQTTPLVLNPESGFSASTTSIFSSGNTINGSLNGIENFTMKSYLKSFKNFNSGATVHPISTATNYIYASAGATKPKRDAVDARVITEVKNKKGRLISNVSLVGGFPTIANGTPYKDSDKDGMSDDWEKARGLNAFSASDRNLDKDGNGYSNLEDYLNYLAGPM